MLGVSLRPPLAFLLLIIFRRFWPRDRSPLNPEKKGWSRPKQTAFLALFGLVCVTGLNALYFFAVSQTSVSLTVLLANTAPALVLLFSLLIGLESFHIERALAVILAFAGATLVGQAALGSGSTLGILAAIGAAVASALYSIFGKIATHRMDSWTILIGTTGFGALGFVPFWLMNPTGILQVLQNPTALLLVLIIVLGPTLLAYTLYLWGLSRVPASVAAITAASEPILGVTWGVLFFNEALSGLQFLGGFLILCAILIGSSLFSCKRRGFKRGRAREGKPTGARDPGEKRDRPDG